MSATELRNKDATIQVKVDGTPLTSSFLTISSFNLKPEAEILKKRFTGEKVSRADLDVKGYDFTFKTQKRAHDWWVLWQKIVSAERAGQPLPTITLTITYSYRDGSGLLKTVVLHGDLVMKITGDDIPDGYQETSWEGYCSFATGN